MPILLAFQAKFTLNYFKKLHLPQNSLSALKWVIYEPPTLEYQILTFGRSLFFKIELYKFKLDYFEKV